MTGALVEKCESRKIVLLMQYNNTRRRRRIHIVFSRNVTIIKYCTISPTIPQSAFLLYRGRDDQVQLSRMVCLLPTSRRKMLSDL